MTPSSFLRFDALLEFWLDTEGRLTISYDELKAEMKEHDCDVRFDIRRWKRVLRRAKPPLENVTTLLGDRLFIDAFFPHATTKYLRRVAFYMDNSKMLKLFLGDRIGNMFRNACRLGKKAIVRMLLEDGRADPTTRDNYAIRVAVNQNRVTIIKLLFDEGRADPTADDNYAIKEASWYGYDAVVKLLLEDGRTDPTAQDNYAIRIASRLGYYEIVKLFLEDGRADPTDDDNYAIRFAYDNGHHAVVELLERATRVKLATSNNVSR